MKKFYAFSSLFYLFILTQASAQVIPDSLRVDWSKAGYQGIIPEPSLIINVKDFGAVGDSIHDDYTAIMNAVNSSAAFRIIYFPAGNYLIKSSISLPDNVVFIGEGTTTNLVFDLSASNNKNAFEISYTPANTFISIDSGYNKGSTVLKLNSTAGFTPNTFAEIREANGAWNTVPANWATYCVGQMVTIKAVNNNYITIEPALRIDYTDSLQPEIRPVTLRSNIGIECLKITRPDTIINGRYGYNIDFTYAANCWVTGVESSKSQASHVMLNACKNITISGCYFHDAFTYDGTATAGYGITMIQHNSDSKVENCIFKHLRHSMVAKQGANGNVFAYNYSLDPYRSENPHDAGADMVLHGHYPFANLFEGNIGQTIIVDDTWGAAGPYNTFFRNRTDLYGIILFDQTVNSDKQNIVGNEVTNTDSSKGYYYLQTSHHFTYDNNIKGTIVPPGTNVLNDESYYLTAQPYFWNVSSSWPSIGGSNVPGTGTIPAKERYFTGDKTTCAKQQPATLQVNISADSIKCNGSVSHIVITASGGTAPYTGTGEFYKHAGSYSFIVTDAAGNSDTENISLNEPASITASVNSSSSQTCKLTGSVTIANTTGGYKPYSYSMNGVNYTIASVFNNLAAGTYTVWIKDSAGCIDSIQNIVVESIPTIKVSAKTTKASACKDDGTITINKSGGTAPFQYSINNINYTSTNVFTNLAAGTYSAWVKDKTGCTDSLENIIVSRANALKISAQKTNVSCKNAADGKITIKASGGIQPYSYSLDSINYSLNNVFTNLSAGTYMAWVKDASACVVSSTIIINNSKKICSSLVAEDIKISVTPNPSTQKFVLAINSSSKKEIQLAVTDIYGRKVYYANGPAGKLYEFGDVFNPGMYILKIRQGSMIKTYKIIKQ